jgi:hypothetical protein
MVKKTKTFNVIAFVGTLISLILIWYNQLVVGTGLLFVSAYIHGGIPSQNELIQKLKIFYPVLLLAGGVLLLLYKIGGTEQLKNIFTNNLLTGGILLAILLPVMTLFIDRAKNNK